MSSDELRKPTLSNWGCRENYYGRHCMCAIEYYGVGLCAYPSPEIEQGGDELRPNPKWRMTAPGSFTIPPGNDRA